MKTGNCSTQATSIKAEDMADFLLDIATFLLSSGAHCGRIWRNCKRIAEHWGFRIHLNPTFTGVMISVWDKNIPENAVTRYKTAPKHNIHFEVLTLISHLSWKISCNEFSFDDAVRELQFIKQKKGYDYRLVSLSVGVACGCLCLLTGGNWVDAAFTMVAASAGALLRNYILKLGFNPFLSFIFAAFITTFIASQNTLWHLGDSPESTLATAVLYLIPGVPLINSIIDLLEGYLIASLARSLFAASILCCISVGMVLCITMLGISKF